MSIQTKVMSLKGWLSEMFGIQSLWTYKLSSPRLLLNHPLNMFQYDSSFYNNSQAIFQIGTIILKLIYTHPTRAKVMLKKNSIKTVFRGFTMNHKPMVVSKQALLKLCLFLPILKKIQTTFGGKFYLFLHSKFTILSVYMHFVTQIKHIIMLK